MLTISSVGAGYPSQFNPSYCNYQSCIACGQTFVSYNAGDTYGPCAADTFTDSRTGSSTSNNNYSSDAEYDACGNLVGSSSVYGWYTSSTPYMLQSGGYVGGYDEMVPTSLAPACAGQWTVVYTFSQTFTDGDTLTVTAAGTFTVNPPQVISPTETQGGCNPSEICCQPCTGEPVDTATGDYWESTSDLAIGGRGPGLRMTRTYSSLAAASGQSSVVGAGWSFGYGMSLGVDSTAGTATVKESNGSQTVFTQVGTGYQGPPRVLATLVHNSDGTWTFTQRARTIYTFNASGQLTSIADLNGNKTALAYNGSGQLQTATDGAGRTLTFAYDPSGLLSSVTDSTGRTVSYAHDGSGNLTSVTDIRGGQWDYGYDSGHLLLTRHDANGNLVMTNTYDSSGRTLTQTDALDSKTSFSYSGNPSTATQVTDPNGNVTEYDYANGILSRKVQAVGTPQQSTWTYGHDQAHSLAVTSITDPTGNTSKFTYDTAGNQASSTDPLGRATSSSYDSLDDMTSHTDGNGVTTSYTYDSKGNLLTRSTPLASATKKKTPPAQTATYGYDANGDLASLTDPDGNKTTYSYDGAGDLTSVTDPAGDTTTYTYDGLGRRTAMTSPRGNARKANPAQFTTSYTYDASGDRLSSTDPLGHKTSWSYDADGNLASSTDPDGSTTSYSYDADNRRTNTTRADGTTLLTAYDPDGDVTSQTNGAGKTTTYSYDALDHLSSSTDPLNRTTTYSYDAVGNLRSETDPQGRTTTNGYDGDNELTSVSYSDGVTPSVSYGYDADGRRASMRDGSGSSSYTYDPLGRLTNVTDGHGSTTTFGYDLADNQTSVTYPNGKTVTRTFDAAGRTSSISDWLRDKTGYGYDADSELTQISPPKNTDSYSYNNAGQITDIAIAAGKGLVASLTYTRDNNGQITSETPSGLPGGAQSYAYNKLNQLTQAGPNGYSYDQADNPTTFAGASGYTYDAANELTQSPTASYTYNALGQRTGVIPASGPATSYGYDQAGNLTSASTGGTTTSYGYDGNGIRVSQSSGGTSTNYAWDLSGKLPTLLSDGNNSYVYNPDGTPLEAIDSSGNVTYYHHDQLGSTRVLTSATGAATNTYSYDPYGTLSGSTGTGAPSLGFAGQYTDSGSGLQYLRARYYDPGTGGFLTRDPLEQLTQQPYSYAQDNPTNGLDPTGLCGFGSIGDFFDCVNPASSGNVAYQGAQAFSNATGIDVTGALGSATNAIVENARPIAEATATVLACATPYVDVVSCPEVILGTAALNVGVNDVNEYNAVNQGCSASPYIRSDLFELTIAGMGLSVAKTLSVANASLDSYASSQSTSARRALNYLNGLATGSGLGATAAHQAQPTGCGCGP